MGGRENEQGNRPRGQPPLRGGRPHSGSTARNLAAPNWRQDASARQANQPGPSTAAETGSSTEEAGAMMTVSGPTFPGPTFADPTNTTDTADTVLRTCFAYCLDRGGGQFTRLIPADMLPNLRGIPAQQTGSDGMIALPLPQGRTPDGRTGNNERVQVLLVQSPVGGRNIDDPVQVQQAIDTIVAAGFPSQQGGGGPRRAKIYCDKWIHDGVCAFTQQGCKYKHEMPDDKATQTSLGLYHGYPAWWKKHQAELARPCDLPDVTPQRQPQVGYGTPLERQYQHRTPQRQLGYPGFQPQQSAFNAGRNAESSPRQQVRGPVATANATAQANTPSVHGRRRPAMQYAIGAGSEQVVPGMAHLALAPVGSAALVPHSSDVDLVGSSDLDLGDEHGILLDFGPIAPPSRAQREQTPARPAVSIRAAAPSRTAAPGPPTASVRPTAPVFAPRAPASGSHARLNTSYNRYEGLSYIDAEDDGQNGARL